MDPSSDKMRKRDIVMNGIDRAASKLGISSHSQEASSHSHEASSSLRDAMAASVTSFLSMTPALSQDHKDRLYPETPLQDTGKQGENRYRGPINPGQAGDRGAATSIRITAPPKKKKDAERDKKDTERDKKATKLQNTKAGGTSGGTGGGTSGKN